MLSSSIWTMCGYHKQFDSQALPCSCKWVFGFLFHHSMSLGPTTHEPKLLIFSFESFRKICSKKLCDSLWLEYFPTLFLTSSTWGCTAESKLCHCALGLLASAYRMFIHSALLKCSFTHHCSAWLNCLVSIQPPGVVSSMGSPNPAVVLSDWLCFRTSFLAIGC